MSDRAGARVSERREIVQLWRQGGASVLVTLVRAEGSTYRQPGARLLIGPCGAYAGTISGGCLEAEVVRRAAWRVREGAAVEQYSTRFDEAADIPFGLGCGGTVDLLMEPVGTPECAALLGAMESSLQGETATVMTWLPAGGNVLQRVVLAPSGEVVFASKGNPARRFGCAAGLQPGREQQGETAGLLIEALLPPQRLWVLGAGDDAKPLVNMAALLGWSVLVADGRAQLARAERFSKAARIVSTEALAIRPDDAVVLMTHSYEQDRELLTRVLPMGPRYLGLLGARHRSSLLVSEAAALLGWTVEGCCERIWAPVGLDLGGDGPEAIALAVIAEAQAAIMGKLGRSRRLTAEDVAEQIARGRASRYLQAQCAR